MQKRELTLKKLYLLDRIFLLLEIICTSNYANQAYLFDFMHIFYRFIGYSETICKFLKNLFEKNEKILHKLHKFNFKNISLDLDKDLNSAREDNNNEKYFFSELIDRLKHFPSYTKPEILNLLSSLCISEDNAIYANQEKIFRHLLEDKLLNKYCFIRINPDIENQIFYLEFRENDGLKKCFSLGEFLIR